VCVAELKSKSETTFTQSQNMHKGKSWKQTKAKRTLSRMHHRTCYVAMSWVMPKEWGIPQTRACSMRHQPMVGLLFRSAPLQGCCLA
jgi:hypothetical protein